MKEGRSLEILSIVIPVFNEVNTAKGIIERVQEVDLPQVANSEIVIVDDDSTEKGRNSQEFSRQLRQVIRYRQDQGGGISTEIGIFVFSTWEAARKIAG